MRQPVSFAAQESSGVRGKFVGYCPGNRERVERIRQVGWNV